MSEKPIQRYEVRLADACEALHIAYTGSGDPLPPEERARLVVYLKARLSDWHPSPKFCAAYDDAWKALVQATLDEHERGVQERRVM